MPNEHFIKHDLTPPPNAALIVTKTIKELTTHPEFSKKILGDPQLIKDSAVTLFFYRHGQPYIYGETHSRLSEIGVMQMTLAACLYGRTILLRSGNNSSVVTDFRSSDRERTADSDFIFKMALAGFAEEEGIKNGYMNQMKRIAKDPNLYRLRTSDFIAPPTSFDPEQISLGSWALTPEATEVRKKVLKRLNRRSISMAATRMGSDEYFDVNIFTHETTLAALVREFFPNYLEEKFRIQYAEPFIFYIGRGQNPTVNAFFRGEKADVTSQFLPTAA